MHSSNLSPQSDLKATSLRWMGIGMFALGLFFLPGCREQESASGELGGELEEGTDRGSTVSATKIKFKQPGGETAFSIKLKEDGLKLVNAREEELVRVTESDSGKYKIKAPDDKVLGYVTGEVPKYRIKDASQEKVLFEFRRQDDGDWKLEDGEEVLLSKVLKRDYGWKIEDAFENELAKVKTEEGRLSIRDAKGEVRLYTNDSMSSIAAVPFGLPQLDQGQAAALSVALLTGK
jgi:hypothetical protein